ncbi:hypothetical protein [Amycolatopsis sp. NBC_00438]|uniref:hypothetical protein n=1 Tax=Amycolatopsis sp. NBC_00438 TaxID=2903558 RepID=UPI002E2075E7
MSKMDASKVSEEFLRFELQQAYDTIRHQATLLAQGVGFLIALDALLVGYGVAQGKGILLILASAIPLAMLFVIRLALSHAAPLALVALRAELTLRRGTDGLVATYLKTRLAGLYREIEKVSVSDDPIVRVEKLNRRLLRRAWRGRSGKVLIAVFFTQAAAPVAAMTLFKMKLF